MKPQLQSAPLITSDSMVVSNMELADESRDQMLSHLRDKIYQHKSLAVVREYVSNAVDEHIIHKIKKPVTVGIRNNSELNDEFFVRDYAKGLDDDGIRRIFGAYGRSTKTGNNKQGGMFGLGSKSFYAYSSTFYVASFHEGTKTTYCCTLGDGDHGIPVAKVINVHSEPTKETGLEVYGEIKKQDIHEFRILIFKFAHAHCEKINVSLFGEIHKQPKLIKKIDVEGCVIRIVESSLLRPVNYAMGGVVYQTDDFDTYKIKHKNNYCVIIDFPIGSMSLPISREGFEDTEANKKKLTLAKKVYDDLLEKEASKFRLKTVKQLMHDYHEKGEKIPNKRIEGEIFSFTPEFVYGPRWDFVYRLSKSGDEQKKVQKEGGKEVVVIIPNNNASGYWIQKVKNFLLSEKKCCWIMTQKNMTKDGKSVLVTEHPEIKKHYTSICARKLKYPKGVKKNTSFAVYDNYNHRVGTHSAFEIGNMILSEFKKSEVETKEEMVKAFKKLYSEITTINNLKRASIGCKSTCPSWGVSFKYYVGSDQLHLDLQEHGILCYRHQEYYDLSDKIVNKEQELDKINNAINLAKNYSKALHLNTALRLCKDNQRNSQRMVKVMDAIRKEKTLRGKIMKNMIDEYSYGVSIKGDLNRDEIRTIMKIKV